jgi:hypothetical protein
MGARGSCSMWLSKTCTLFIGDVKISSHMREILTQQILDRDMQNYLMAKENWTRQAKAYHNLWHTGEGHKQYYGG